MQNNVRGVAPNLFHHPSTRKGCPLSTTLSTLTQHREKLQPQVMVGGIPVPAWIGGHSDRRPILRLRAEKVWLPLLHIHARRKPNSPDSESGVDSEEAIVLSSLVTVSGRPNDHGTKGAGLLASRSCRSQCITRTPGSITVRRTRPARNTEGK